MPLIEPGLPQLRENPILCARAKTKKNRFGSILSITVRIASTLRYQGNIKLTIFRNGSFGTNVRYIPVKDYKDGFTVLADDIKTCETLDDLMVLLIGHGFRSLLKKYKSYNKTMDKYL